MQSIKHTVMKKIILLFVVIGLSTSLFAQTDNPDNDNPKHKIGYYCSLGVDYSFGSAVYGGGYPKVCQGARLHWLNGIQFNPWLSLSLDLQLAYSWLHESYYPVPMKYANLTKSTGENGLHNFGVKLGVDFRYRILNRYQWSPYIGVSIGPSFELVFDELENGNVNGDQYMGVYFSEYVGCAYRYKPGKNLFFGPGLSFEAIGDPFIFGFLKFEIQL